MQKSKIEPLLNACNMKDISRLEYAVFTFWLILTGFHDPVRHCIYFRRR
jgi:hypothetical protein